MITRYPLRAAAAAALAVALVSLLAGCGAAPKAPPAAPTAPAPPCPPATAAPVPVPPPSPQESLLERVPATAVLAVVVRRGALGLPRRLLAGAPAMQQELAAFLTTELGVDLTGVEGAVVWSDSLAARSGALFVRLSQGGTLKGRRVGQHRGVALVELEATVVAAAVPGGVVAGSPAGVATAIDLATGNGERLAASAPLGFMLEDAARDADLVAGAHLPSVVDSGSVAMVQSLGVQSGLLTYRRDGLVTARVLGDPERLGAVRELLRAGVGLALQGLERAKDKAIRSHHVAEAVGAIVGYHQALKLYREVEPRIEGRWLSSRFRLPELAMHETFLFYAGAAAAVAVPSFVKYVRRAKASEARVNVKRIADGARAFHEQQRKAGRRFAFPATTPWTPAAGCCAAGGKCPADAAAWKHPTWKALGFTLGDAHFYQYRVVSEGKGKQARFTVEARGDLDCNGVRSSFRLSGHLAPDGALVVGPLEVQHETE